MFEKCPKCGRMHYRTDPCGATKPSANAAGTQAPPVDTISKPSGRPRSTKPSEGKTKRAAEMRDYMRQYRARKKADER